MLEKFAKIEHRFEEINNILLGVGDDYQRAAELSIERAEFEPLANKAKIYRQLLNRAQEAHALLDSEDEELRQLAEVEIEELNPQIDRLESELKHMLLPQDRRDRRNVIMEIRAGTGGDEAALFAADLFRMYSRYAELMGWHVEVLSVNEIGIGGYKEIIFLITRQDPYFHCHRGGTGGS